MLPANPATKYARISTIPWIEYRNKPYDITETYSAELEKILSSLLIW